MHVKEHHPHADGVNGGVGARNVYLLYSISPKRLSEKKGSTLTGGAL